MKLSNCPSFVSVISEVGRIGEMFIELVCYFFVGGEGMVVEFD